MSSESEQQDWDDVVQNATGYRDKETLERLYVDLQYSGCQIADRFGVTTRTIYNWLEKHGIERRSWSEGQKLRGIRKPATYRTSHSGYEEWKTNIDGKQETASVHKLVAIAEFGFENVSGKVVHHKNGIPWDNRPSNLEPLTDSEHKRLHANEWDRDDRG